MRVNYEIVDNTTSFQQLKIGECFIVNGDAHIKCNSIIDKHYNEFNCVQLETGNLVFVTNNTKVKRMSKSEITVRG